LAEKGLKWANEGGRLRDIAISYLSLGQAYLSLGQAEGSMDFSIASAHLERALIGSRQAGREDDVVLTLLAWTGLYRVQSYWERAHQVLHEAMARAKRSGMALLQTDVHLEYARLYLAQGQPEKARPHLTTAEKMITDLGYGRRRQDVLDLEAQLRRTH
jgi:tetratricopeptide (TPR) repeat protein